MDNNLNSQQQAQNPSFQPPYEQPLYTQQPYVQQPYVQQPYYTQPVPQGAPQQPTPGPVYQRIDRKVIRQLRHKSEIPLYIFMIVLNVLIIVGVVLYFFASDEENQKYYDTVAASVTESADVSSDKLQKELDNMPEALEYLVMIIFTAVAIPFIVSYAYAQYRSMSVRITEKTYPEIYAIVEEYAQKLGMKRVPKVYMVQGDGMLNAFSAFIPFRQYIEVYADLLEVAYREYHDMDTIRFIIAHEMSHIYFKHATMHYYYNIMFSQLIPILGPTFSRAREYSCDRLAQLLSGSDGVEAILALVAGKHLYKQVDKIDYVQHALSVKGLFVFCYNLVSSHPVMTKRVLALADPLRRSGKLF
jgi:Zn-dependent protease with chaperone function